MKLALVIITVVTLLAFILFYLTTDRNMSEPAAMPWHITLHDPDHSEVFGITLNRTSLEQARKHFGQLDGIALYQNEQGEYSLEAYFGKLSIDRFSARLIANLDAPQQELEQLTEHTVKRTRTKDGSWRWTLTPEKQLEQGARTIKALSYIPDYAGMDGEFIRQRFGEPSTRETLDETSEVWFYPRLGVRIMIDSAGKELFEYMTPAQFMSNVGVGQ